MKILGKQWWVDLYEFLVVACILLLIGAWEFPWRENNEKMARKR